MKLIYLLVLLLSDQLQLTAQNKLDSLIPIRGFCIAAPPPAGVDSFVTFIAKELAPRQVNVLILRVDYGYQYEKHPDCAMKILYQKPK